MVGTDGSYVKPFSVDYIFIAPGQTVTALLTADRASRGLRNARYYMAARPLLPNNPFVIFNNSTSTAVLEYADDAAALPSGGAAPDPEFPVLPAINNSTAADAYVIVTLMVELELRARSLLALRCYREVTEMLRDYIPSCGKSCSGEDTSSSSLASLLSTGFDDLGMISRAKLLSPDRHRSDDTEPDARPVRSFRCFDISELKRRVLAGLSKNPNTDTQWRYEICGIARTVGVLTSRIRPIS